MLTTITRRLSPCTCGCKGSDSWHRPNFQRKLRDERVESGKCEVSALSREVAYDRVARVSMPWSEEPVAVVRVVVGPRNTVLGWFFR